jgi:hypothetical protein
LMNGIDFCGSYLLQQAASQSHGKLSVDWFCTCCSSWLFARIAIEIDDGWRN